MHIPGFNSALLGLVFFSTSCERSGLPATSDQSEPTLGETTSAADLVRSEFEGVLIPNLEFDAVPAAEAIEFIFVRANRIQAGESGEWIFGYSISNVHPGIEVGLDAPQEPLFTGQFESVSAIDALDRVCEQTGFTYSIDGRGRFVVVRSEPENQ